MRFGPSQAVLLLAPAQPEVGGPDGDSLSGAALAEALSVTFPELMYVALDDLRAARNALVECPDVPVLLATTGRWGIPDSTRALARTLATDARNALHLALCALDAAEALPLPAVTTHGFRAANLQALGAALAAR